MRQGIWQSKPTEYNGRKYRSGLEARWACFFDSLGLYFEYESAVIELPNGMKYRPDFYLPTCATILETKPTKEVAERERKIDQMALMAYDTPLFGMNVNNFTQMVKFVEVWGYPNKKARAMTWQWFTFPGRGNMEIWECVPAWRDNNLEWNPIDYRAFGDDWPNEAVEKLKQGLIQMANTPDKTIAAGYRIVRRTFKD